MGRIYKFKWCLFGFLIAVLVIISVLVLSSVFIPEGLDGAFNWLANNSLAYKMRGIVQHEKLVNNTMVEMEVDCIGISKTDHQPVVFLKQKGAEIYVPVWIGPLEASALAVTLEEIKVPRPLTADLLCTVIEKMGAEVNYVIVNDLKEHTFYANIILSANRGKMEIDARPSDAIAVALRVKVPIYMAKTVLDKVGVPLDLTKDRYISMHTGYQDSDMALECNELNRSNTFLAQSNL